MSGQPDRFFTIFHLLILTGAVTGAFAAARFCCREFGWLSVLVAAPLGFIAGAFVGNLPWVAAVAWMRYDFKRCSVAKLKQRLENEYFISHLLIAELVIRGEPLEQFRGYVAGLLQSANPDRPRFGKMNAQIWFPDLLPAVPESSNPGDHNT